MHVISWTYCDLWYC